MTELSDKEKAAKLRRICELLDWDIKDYGGEDMRLAPEDPVLGYGDTVIGHARRKLWERGKWDISRQCDSENALDDSEWRAAQWRDESWHTPDDACYAETELDAIIAALEKMQAQQTQAARPKTNEERLADLETRVAMLEGQT